jgi:hypothetical protein
MADHQREKEKSAASSKEESPTKKRRVLPPPATQEQQESKPVSPVPSVASSEDAGDDDGAPNKGEVLVAHVLPNGIVRRTRIAKGGDFQAMQNMVGGYLEAIRVPPDVYMMVDEEAKCKRPCPPKNLHAIEAVRALALLSGITDRVFGGTILGPVVFTKEDGVDGKERSLSEREMKAIEKAVAETDK